jgi:hypothetical protein
VNCFEISFLLTSLDSLDNVDDSIVQHFVRVTLTSFEYSLLYSERLPVLNEIHSTTKC